MARKELEKHGGGTTRIGVDFVLPTSLGPLKPGDRVTLQVLHACGGYRRLMKKRGRAERAPHDILIPPDRVTVPLLSNKLEFVVTKAMLASAFSEREQEE